MKPDYWLTPPELYERLDAEFHFDFDPCPFPRAQWDGLEIPWGDRNYVNAPFAKKDGGIVAWERKALAEAAQGKLVYFLKPVNTTEAQLFLKARRVDDLGRIPWVATDNSGRRKAMRHVLGVLL